MDNNLTKTQKEILKDLKVQKYKIGNKARVRKGLKNIFPWLRENHYCCTINRNMEKLEGTMVTIANSWTEPNGVSYYNIEEDNGSYVW